MTESYPTPEQIKLMRAEIEALKLRNGTLEIQLLNRDRKIFALEEHLRKRRKIVNPVVSTPDPATVGGI